MNKIRIRFIYATTNAKISRKFAIYTYKPVSSLTDDGPLKFVVPGGSNYIDLAH